MTDTMTTEIHKPIQERTPVQLSTQEIFRLYGSITHDFSQSTDAPIGICGRTALTLFDLAQKDEQGRWYVPAEAAMSVGDLDCVTIPGADAEGLTSKGYRKILSTDSLGLEANSATIWTNGMKPASSMMVKDRAINSHGIPTQLHTEIFEGFTFEDVQNPSHKLKFSLDNPAAFIDIYLEGQEMPLKVLAPEALQLYYRFLNLHTERVNSEEDSVHAWMLATQKFRTDHEAAIAVRNTLLPIELEHLFPESRTDSERHEHDDTFSGLENDVIAEIAKDTLFFTLLTDLGIDWDTYYEKLRLVSQDQQAQKYAQMMRESKNSDPKVIIYHNYGDHIVPATAYGLVFMIREGLTDDEIRACSKNLIMHDYIMGPDGEYKTAKLMLEEFGHSMHITSQDMTNPEVMSALAIAPTKVKFEFGEEKKPIMTPYARFDDETLKKALLEEFERNGITFEDGLLQQENFWQIFRKYTGVLSAADFNKVNLCQLYPEALGLAVKDSLLISAEFGEYTRAVNGVEVTGKGIAMQLAIQQSLYDQIAEKMDTSAAGQVLEIVNPKLRSFYDQMISLAGNSLRQIAPVGQENRWENNARAHYAAVELMNQLKILQSLLSTTGYFLSTPLRNDEVLEQNKKRLVQLTIDYEAALNKTS